MRRCVLAWEPLHLVGQYSLPDARLCAAYDSEEEPGSVLVFRMGTFCPALDGPHFLYLTGGQTLQCNRAHCRRGILVAVGEEGESLGQGGRGERRGSFSLVNQADKGAGLLSEPS